MKAHTPTRALRGNLAVWLVASILATGGCDCEDQIRKLVSNPGDRRVAAKPNPKADGPSESEPNESPAAASRVQLGKELRLVKGSIATGGDVDWFAISSASGTFELEVQPDLSLDISLHVEVEGGASNVYNESPSGGAESIAALKLGARPLLIGLKGEGGSTGSYSLRFKRQLDAAGLEAEPNDDASVASNFSMPGEVEGTYDRDDDRDVYRLTGDANKLFVLEIGPIAGGRHIARIYDDASLTTPQMTVQVVEGPVQVPNIVLDTEKPRWLVMTPISAAKNARYKLSATMHPASEEMLEAEPNDVVAQSIVFGQPEEGARRAVVAGYLHIADDRDRFEITPPDAVPMVTPIAHEHEGEDHLRAHRGKVRPRVPVNAKLSWTDAQSSLGMTWRGADGTEVEFRQMMTKLEVKACGLNLDQGAATVEVRAERLGASSKPGVPQYTLSLEESSGEDSSFEAEPNDESAVADIVEDRRRGAFAIPDDVDVYAFAVWGEPDSVHSTKVTAGAIGVDIVLKVTDDSGGIIANIDNAGIGSREFVTVDLPPGLYFAELRWKGGELCSPYEIELER